MKNIVLIGMPSSGKTTIGKIVALDLHRDFYDLDALIETTYRKSIPQIFSEEGEPSFRDKETEVVKRVSAFSGAVLSCGGGVVLREENMRFLKENGVVVYVKRDVTKLSTKGRPLSKDLDTLRQMEKIRAPLYERYADNIVTNDTTPQETAQKVIRSVYETIDR